MQLREHLLSVLGVQSSVLHGRGLGRTQGLEVFRVPFRSSFLNLVYSRRLRRRNRNVHHRPGHSFLSDITPPSPSQDQSPAPAPEALPAPPYSCLGLSYAAVSVLREAAGLESHESTVRRKRGHFQQVTWGNASLPVTSA